MSVEEAVAALKTLEKGLELGAVRFERAKLLFKETWRRAFGQYDIERVFWQGIYGGGLAMIVQWAYQYVVGTKVATKVVATHPELLMPMVPPPYGLPVFWGAIWIEQILRWLIPGYETRTEEERRTLTEEVTKARAEVIEEMGIPPIIDDLLAGKYSSLFPLAPAGISAFSEYRRYKRQKDTLETTESL